MNMLLVESQNFAAIGYEEGTLYVRFKSGDLHSYLMVPEDIYRSLLWADSKDDYFHENIEGQYDEVGDGSHHHH